MEYRRSGRTLARPPENGSHPCTEAGLELKIPPEVPAPPRLPALLLPSLSHLASRQPRTRGSLKGLLVQARLTKDRAKGPARYLLPAGRNHGPRPATRFPVLDVAAALRDEDESPPLERRDDLTRGIELRHAGASASGPPALPPWRPHRGGILEIEFERLAEIGERLLFVRAEAGDVDVEALGNEVLPRGTRRSGHQSPAWKEHQTRRQHRCSSISGHSFPKQGETGLGTRVVAHKWRRHRKR